MAAGFGFLLVPLLARWTSLQAAGTLFCVLLWLDIALTALTSFGIYSPIQLGFPIVMLLSCFLVSVRLGVLSIIGICLVNILMLVMHLQGYPFPQSINTPTFLMDRFVANIAVYILIWLVIWLYEYSRSQALTIAQTTLTELEQARQRAEFASQIKSEFLAKVSHELRTPLNAIIGYTEILQEEVAEPETLEAKQEELQSDLSRVDRSAKHLLALINDLLDLSRIEAEEFELHIERFSLRHFLGHLESLVQPLAAERNNQFDLKVQRKGDICHLQDAPEFTVKTDQSRLMQLLSRLLSNACKFTNDGQVQLFVELREGAAPALEFRVVDDGIGISKEQQERIFQPFIQGRPGTDYEYGGIGMGLSVSQQLCQALGGSIQVESALGQGATFIVWVPLDEAPFSPSCAPSTP